MPNRCKRSNGVITYPGDRCHATNQAGGCKDSASVAGAFAASGIKINN